MASRKARMTALDVRSAVNALRPKIVGLRLANIYDVNFSRRMYMLKFARGDEKYHILIESGIRFHTTTWQRDKNAIPSAFVMRLRKFLRTRRLESFKQLGADRVIEFTFGTGDATTHLIVELYVSGNVVLTDARYTILSILRPHTNIEEAGRIAAHETYPIQLAFTNNTLVRVSDLLSLCYLTDRSSWDTVKNEAEKALHNRIRSLKGDSITQESNALERSTSSEKPVQTNGLVKSKPAGITVRDAVAYLVPFAHSSLILHSLHNARDALSTFPDTVIEHEGTSRKPEHTLFVLEGNAPWKLEWILHASVECLKKLVEVSSPEDYLGSFTGNPGLFPPNRLPPTPARKGWILSKPLEVEDSPSETVAKSSEEAVADMVTTETPYKNEDMIDFSPVLLQHFRTTDSSMRLHTFACFLECLDVYFSHGELLRQSRVTKNLGEQQLSKVEKIQYDQQRRLDQLRMDQDMALRHASLIQANLNTVQQCITMLQAALGTGVSWRELDHHIKLERKKGHPLAHFIHAMDFEHNQVILLLSDEEESAEIISNELVPVPVTITLSAYGNIEAIHDYRKQLLQKERRTEVATKTALDKAQSKVSKKLKEVSLVGVKGGMPCGLVRLRKHFWFEKFNWFISSENFLIIAGRDAVQNDMLYKRYLEKNDLFVHADAHGAPACVIKNPENLTIPPVTLLEAGRMSVCRSSAWEHKLITGSWWVYPSQVSKTVPAGEYIVSGAFMIRGKKNMLPPSRLEMGIGVLFQLGEDSLASHEDERSTAQPSHYLQYDSARVDSLALYPNQNDRQHVEILLKEEDDAWNEVCRERLRKRMEKNEKRQQCTKTEFDNCASEDTTSLPRGIESLPQRPEKTVAQKAQQPSTRTVRGKKHKLKKMKEKYGDQDPEERELRMALLGSTAMKHVTQTGCITTEKEAEREHDATTVESKLPDVYHSETATRNSADVNKSVDGNDSQDNHDCNDRRPVAKENEANNLRYDTNVSQLRYLTGQPHSNDTLLAALPVCAPWGALQSYKYKMKLGPGSLKKGTAGQQIIKSFIQQAQEATERELLRLMDTNDMNNALLGNIQILRDFRR